MWARKETVGRSAGECLTCDRCAVNIYKVVLKAQTLMLNRLSYYS